jgi:hypothetical protein
MSRSTGAVEPRLDQTVISHFERIRDDLVGPIERVNARFDTDIRARQIKDTPQPILGWHVLVNDIHDGIEQDIGARFQAKLAASEALRNLVAREEAVHARYLEANERPG